MKGLILGAICLYTHSACIWMAWKELSLSSGPVVRFPPSLLIIFTVYVICQAGSIPEKEKQRNAPIQHSLIRVNVEVNVCITRTVSNPFSLYAPIQYSLIRVNVEVNVWITRTVSNPFSLYYLWYNTYTTPRVLHFSAIH